MMQCKMWWNDAMRYDVIYIPHLTTTAQQFSHQTTFPAQHTIPHLTTFSVKYHQITQRDVEFGVMWNVLQWDVVPYTSQCGCDVEYVR